ncbi:MAG TPA: ribosome-binding factor A, partial [Brevundimonas sp.]|nr:ribosome-binding factor A [Brevundimonas sp.]
KALNTHAKFLRGALGRHIDMRFTPDLRFRHDESFMAAERLNRLLDDPRVRADVEASESDDEGEA